MSIVRHRLDRRAAAVCCGMIAMSLVGYACGRESPSTGDIRALALEGLRARAYGTPVQPPESGDLRDTALEYFPGVRFFVTDLPMEHGGTIRLSAAVDSAGQLYLLDSRASFRLLVERHFRGPLALAALVPYAKLSAQFSGVWEPTKMGRSGRAAVADTLKTTTIPLGPGVYRVLCEVPWLDSIAWLDITVRPANGVALANRTPSGP